MNFIGQSQELRLCRALYHYSISILTKYVIKMPITVTLDLTSYFNYNLIFSEVYNERNRFY